jgi:glycerol dehydrogenase
MAKIAELSPLNFVRTGPAQYVNRAGILRNAGDCICPWGNRALVSGGRNALAVAEGPLIKSLEKTGIAWGKHLFTGECSPTNIAKIKGKAQELKANVIIGVGGGKSLDAAKQAAADLGLPVVCIPTIAATCAATSAISIIYDDRGVYEESHLQPRNPTVVLVDPKIIADSPGIYLRAGILDSLAKWFEGRTIWPSLENPDVQTAAAIQLAGVLYRGHRKYALDAVRLNAEHRVEDPLIQTIDIVIFLTGMVQTLAKGILFTAIAHSLHNCLTLIEESQSVLHGLKVGYGIVVGLCVEKCPQEEFEDVLSFLRQLGLEPSLKGLNMPFDREVVLRVADETATLVEKMTLLKPPVDKFVIASAMEKLEARFG